jgi:hypothetical protein
VLRAPAGAQIPLLIDVVVFALIAILSAVSLGLLSSPGDSKLYRLGFAGFDPIRDVGPSFLIVIWAFSLATLPVRLRAKPANSASKLGGAIRERVEIGRSLRFDARTATVMGLLGIAGLAISLSAGRAEVFSTRGEGGGNGLLSLLYWAAATFAAYVLSTWNRGDSRWFVALAVALTAGLFLTGNRSPLAVVGVAFLIRLVIARRGKLLVLMGLFVPVGLFVFAYQSAWRSQVAKGRPSGVADVISFMASNPLGEFLRLGLDSIDGNVLVRALIERGYTPRWFDPLISITNFVPRQIWPGKPTLLGSEIGANYLGVNGGGIFLSGPGYLTLVTGSISLGMIAFVIFMLSVKWLSSSPKLPPLVAAALVTLAARFSIAGDAFDIFLTLQIILIFAICLWIGRALPIRREGARPSRSLPDRRPDVLQKQLP